MKTLLLATDFSNAGNNALHYGCEMALTLGARVVLVHAYSLPLGGYDSMAPLEVISEMQSASNDALRELRKELESKYGPKLEVLTHAAAGSSDGIIAEAVQKFVANIVVVGIVDHAGVIKKHLTGSTVTDVIHELTVPVLIVPEYCKYQKISKLVFAVDPQVDTDSTPAIMVRQFADLFKADLELLAVLPMPIDAKQAEQTRAHIEGLFSATNHKTSILHAVDVKKGLEEALNASTADLVLLHPKKHGFLSRLFESGTTTRLVYALRAPMLSFHT